MKKVDIILTSDWHLRDTIPICRKDDFWETLWNKVDFVAKLQKQYDCPVLHAGDLFHHWKPSPYLLSKTIEHLPKEFYTIYGQHDLPQHNFDERYRSGIYVLERATALKVLTGIHWGQNPYYHSGWSFGHTLGRLIMVWHHMVWQGRRPFPNCTDPSAYAILKKYENYDLILTGDNHKAFVENYEGRILVNPGSLTRQAADQIDFRPRIYLYDARTNTVEPVYLPIDENAVTRSHIEKTEERDQRISAFIERLGGEWQAEMSFEANLEAFFKVNKTSESIQNIIYNAIDTR